MNLINLYNTLSLYITYMYIVACRVNKDAVRTCGKLPCKLCEVAAVKKYWPMVHTARGQCVILPKDSTESALVRFECVPCNKPYEAGTRISNVWHHIESSKHFEVGLLIIPHG